MTVARVVGCWLQGFAVLFATYADFVGGDPHGGAQGGVERHELPGQARALCRARCQGSLPGRAARVPARCVRISEGCETLVMSAAVGVMVR